MSLLEIDGLAKHYGGTPVFEGLSLRLEPGEFVALVGESGVGKSTLLNAIAGLDTVDAGTVRLDGIDIGTLDERGRALLRREKLGFVFQAFHLLPHLSVHDNVALPLHLRGAPDAARVEAVLEAVGLHGLGKRLPAQLSGGQMQRVAIARALVHQPRLVLADEPTGNLDPTSARRALDVIAAQVRAAGAACLLVTHSEMAAGFADRVMHVTPSGLR
jgi:putative ABC transport system ATP-binding protein